MKSAALFLFLSSLLSDCAALQKPMDCSDIFEQHPFSQSGVRTIYPFGGTYGVQAYCDMTTDGGGWTYFSRLAWSKAFSYTQVIQRRMDGTVNFYRPWHQYKIGFGEPDGEYWLGLEFIHILSSRRPHELLVEMEDFDGRNASARYSSFSVGSECDRYKLQVSGFTDGGAGDSLTYHNDMKFFTFDQDTSTGNCSKLYLGAFWYNSCHYTNPNGVYRWGADKTIYAVGVDWRTWKGYDYSLKSISMKIRPAK